MSQIFISYSHADSEYVRQLAQALEKEGFSAWVDERIDYGSTWTDEVQRRLDACAAFILVMTPSSFASRWVNNELSRAMRKNKPIFPLLLEGEEPWLAVESIQFLDVRGGKLPEERFFQHLAAFAARSAPVPQPPPASAVPFEEEPVELFQPVISEPLVEKVEDREQSDQLEKQVQEKAELSDGKAEVSEHLTQPEEQAQEKPAPRSRKIPKQEIRKPDGTEQAAVHAEIPERKEIPVPKKGRAIKKEKLKGTPGQLPRSAIPARRKWLIGTAVILSLAVIGTGLGVLPRYFKPQIPPVSTMRQASPPGTLPASTAMFTLAANSPVSRTISTENASQLVELQTWRDWGAINGAAGQVGMDQIMAVATSRGIFFLNPETLKPAGDWHYAEDVTALAFTKNGETLAVGLRNNTIQVRSVDGYLRHTLETTDLIRSLAFDPWGKYLAAGLRNGSVLVWSMDDGSQLLTLTGHQDLVRSVTFLWGEGGNVLASGSMDGTVRLWKIPEGELVQTLQGDGSGIASLARGGDPGPDGSGEVLAAGDINGNIWIWLPPENSLLFHLKSQDQVINSLAFNPQGDLLAAGSGDTTTQLWKLDGTGELVGTLQGHKSQVSSVFFNSDGTNITTAAVDGTVRLWDVKTLTQKASQEEFAQIITTSAASPDGKFLALGMLDASLILFDTSLGNEVMRLTSLPDLIHVGFSRDGEDVFAVTSQGIGKWHLSDSSLTMFPLDFPALLYSIVFSPQGDEVAIGLSDGSIGVYPLEGSLQNKGDLTRGDDPVILVQFSRDASQLAAGYEDGSLVIWKETGPMPVQGLDGIGLVRDFTFTADGATLLAAFDDGSLHSVNVADGTVSDLFIPGLDADVMLMQFSPDGELLALALEDYSIALVDYSRLAVLNVLKGHSLVITGMKFMADDTLLVTSSYDGTLRLWGIEP